LREANSTTANDIGKMNPLIAPAETNSFTGLPIPKKKRHDKMMNAVIKLR
jgi:hypothetical protein